MRWIFAALLVAAPVTGFGESQDLTQRIAQCAAIEDDAGRLQCFDALTRELALALAKQRREANPLPVDAGDWKVNTVTNPADGSRAVTLILLDEKKHAALILRCKQSDVDLIIHWNDSLGSEMVVRGGEV